MSEKTWDNPENSPINDLELQNLAMQLNAMGRQQAKSLMAAEMLERCILKAANIIDADEGKILHNAVTLDLLLTAKEAAVVEGGRTNMHLATSYLLAAALRCANGLVNGIRQQNDPSADPDAPIVI